MEVSQALHAFGSDWGTVGRSTSWWGEEAHRTGMEHRLSCTGIQLRWWPECDPRRVGKGSAFNKQSACVGTRRATHVTLGSGGVLIGLPSSQLAFLSQGNFGANCCHFPSIPFSWRRFLNPTMRTIIHWTGAFGGNFRQLLNPKTHWIPSHPCAYWNNVPVPASSDPGKYF